MSYKKWVKELKANLKDISRNERQSILDYYAEAYADRLAAGFTEEQILEEFGSPQRAAQALNGEIFDEAAEPENYNGQTPQTKEKSPVFVTVLIIAGLILPVFIVVILMAVATAIFTILPFGIAGTGVAFMINAFGCFFSADAAAGLFRLGLAILSVGVAMAKT